MARIRVVAAVIVGTLMSRSVAEDRVQPAAVDEAAIVAELRRTGATIELDDNGHAISLSWESGTDHRFGNAELKRAAGLKYLKEVWLVHSDVTDSGLREIRSMRQLESLAVICRYDRGQRTKVTDEGMPHLQELTKLRVLRLDNSDVTDRGLVQFRSLRNLEELDLFGTEISDAGLIHLRGLRNLKYLNISETQWELKRGAISAKAAAELKQHLPNCDIDF